MVKKKNNLYVCEACGFKYKKKELAKKCEYFCREKGACNSEIQKQAVKNP